MELKEGIKEEKQIVVSNKDTAKIYGSGTLDVFATPAMIALMENTAYLSVQSFLVDTFTTVGSEINAKHIKATAVGMKVVCESILTKVEGKKLTFEINAKDEQGQIGIATHTRYIVDVDKFMSRIK